MDTASSQAVKTASDSQIYSGHVLNAGWLYGTVLLLLCSSILFGNIGGWDLSNPDEPRYAQVAREMLKTGNYLVPHLGAEIYSHKPPLFFWLIALCSIPVGDVSAASARLPSALAALGVILLTYLLGRRLFNPLAGFVASLILFTAIEFFWLATRANLDMTLTLWTTLTLFLFYCGYTNKPGNQWLYWLSYFFMGLAVLTKGPVGFFIPFIAISLFLIVKREFAKFRDIKPLTGLLIILVTVSFWLVPAGIMGGVDYTRDILFKENLGRVKNSFSHNKPLFYYLLPFTRDFLPWTFFIPSAAIYFWRQNHAKKTGDFLFPLIWFLGGFIFLSFISSKRNIYLLPLYPAAALMMAKFWCDAISAERVNQHNMLSKHFKIPLYLLFGSLVLFSIFSFLGAVGRFRSAEFLQPCGSTIYPATILLCVLSLLGILLTTSGARIFTLFSLIIILMSGVFVYSVSIILPHTNDSKSPRAFVERVERIVKPGDTLLYFRVDQSLFYFFKRNPYPEIKEFEKLAEHLNVSTPVYCLMQKKNYHKIPEDIKRKVTIRDEGEFGDKKYYFLFKPGTIR